MSEAIPSEGRRLRELYEAEWAWRLDQFADVTGLDVGVDPDRPLYARLPDASPGAQADRLAYWTRVSADLERLDPAGLSPRERVDHQVYRAQISTLIARQTSRDFEMPLNSDSAFWSETAAIARRPMRRAEDRARWIEQMRDVPRYFGEVTAQMRAGLRRGFTPPRVTLVGRERAIQTIAEATAEESVYFTPFRAGGEGDVDLRAEARSVIAEVVVPAHRELLAFFQSEYRPNCRSTLAAADLPDGRDYYLSKVREHTTESRAPEEIHAFGLDEVARLRAEMSAAMAETGHAGPLAAFAAFLRDDPQFYVATGDELLMRAAWIAKKFDGVAGAYFRTLPRARFAIRPVPSEIAPYYTAGRGGPGVYLLNTFKPETRPLYSLPALTLHESAPGHAFQLAVAMEDADLPAFRRQTYLPAYAEGWALYCEHLGLEMGIYETPYERFGMLAYQVWRAARLVVDTGIHWFGWSREQAVAFLRANTTLPEHEIASEVDRYISWPAQALSYYLGQACLQDCRREAQDLMGPRFDLRDFHDMILALGSVPLEAVRSATRRLIHDRPDAAPGAFFGGRR